MRSIEDRMPDRRLDPNEVHAWVDRAVEHLAKTRPEDKGGWTYLNIRNYIYNALEGPHIHAGQVRFAVARHPRLIGKRPRSGFSRMTRYTIKAVQS